MKSYSRSSAFDEAMSRDMEQAVEWAENNQKPNRCFFEFFCENRDCIYYTHDRHFERCKYEDKDMRCTSKIAQTNAMVDELKKRGVRI